MNKLVLLNLLAGLLTLCCCTSQSEYARMRQGLDSLNLRNRTDQPFTVEAVDSYVHYFARHGSANDQLLAHYLLGRAYHDRGEVPMALQCYQEAAACADTTRQDCDYAQLARVYSQMDAVFYQQGLYQEEAAVIDLSIRYAWLGNDTLAALLCHEQKGKMFVRMNKPDSALQTFQQTCILYSRYGYHEQSAVILGRTLKILIGRGLYEEAWKNLNTYETYSGLFDSCHNIIRGREIFYYYKGQLYLHDGKTDSAECCFRKELSEGHSFNNQNAAALGLALLYEQRHMPDSSSKYHRYAYAMNDSVYAHQTVQTVKRMQSMYDYSRYKESARIAEKESEHHKAIWQWGGTITVIILILVFHIIHRVRNERKIALIKYEQGQLRIRQIEKEIACAQQDIVLLQTHKGASMELIAEKERQIETLISELSMAKENSQQHKDRYTLSMAENKLREDSFYQELQSCITKGKPITEVQWKETIRLLCECFPDSSCLLSSHRHLLSDDEYKVGVLIRLHVQPSSISHIVNKSEGSITYIRSRLYEKLFGQCGKARDFDKSICSIC